jgi:lipopolysaccharide transport system permease protein
MPEWLQGVVAWNPLTLAVDALRGALLFGIPPRPEPLAGLALLAAGLLALAATLLRRAERA